MILDGYGLNEKTEHNAVALGKTPVMDRLMKEYPFAKGNASGMAVGLPEGQMGNSEVGHLNMGAGRIVYQELTRITKEIEDGTFFENPALMEAVNNCKEKHSALHLFGLLSDGGVHSHNTHLYGLLELAKKNGLSDVYVHAFLDGRDTPPASGKEFAEALEAKMAEIGVGKIASVMGRYYAMDRDNNYDRVQLAYDALTAGKGEQAPSAQPRSSSLMTMTRRMNLCFQQWLWRMVNRWQRFRMAIRWYSLILDLIEQERLQEHFAMTISRALTENGLI